MRYPTLRHGALGVLLLLVACAPADKYLDVSYWERAWPR